MIGIIGKGIVGEALFVGFQAIGHQVCVHDIKLDTTVSDVERSDVVFVCVPTVSLADGHCDTIVVESVLGELDTIGYQGIVAIKSTVIPGTTQRLIDQYPNLRICFCPEFLKEKSAEADFLGNMDVLIVGTHDKDVYDTIVKVHKHIPHNVADQLTPTEAEMAKYFCNVYNALRITFASGMYRVCGEIDVDYQKILAACIKRDNIDPNYLKAGINYIGYGGKCLPKDSSAFSSFVKDLGIDLDLFHTIVSDNIKHKS